MNQVKCDTKIQYKIKVWKFEEKTTVKKKSRFNMCATNISTVEDKNLGHCQWICKLTWSESGIKCKSCTTKENNHQEIYFKYCIEFQETIVHVQCFQQEENKIYIIKPDMQRKS